MNSLYAIAWLTVKAAFRFRLVVLLGIALLGLVVVLPLIIKDDQTAQGLTQILLTYNLSVITALLGFATLWLACGTLARDVEEGQIQMVAVKPVYRWQIWLGKWLGIMTVNALLLALAGTAVYSLVLFRTQKLTLEEKAKLQNEVLVARASLKEKPVDYEPMIEQIYQERLKQTTVAPGDRSWLRQQIRELLKSRDQLVQPGFGRKWEMDLGMIRHWLRDQPLFLRVKFSTAQKGSTLDTPIPFRTLWQVGPPETARVWREEKSLASETFHEFPIPANLFTEQGILTIFCFNPTETALLFQLEDGMEVLYREGGFGLNFFRGVLIIFCWLSLLAAMGLAAASYLSFPVAAFMSLGLLFVGLSSGTISQVVEEGGVTAVDHETGLADTQAFINQIALPVFKGLLTIVKLVEEFSPVDALSSGRSISWRQMGRAAAQVTLFMGGIFAAFGITAFTRRELAVAQGIQ